MAEALGRELRHVCVQVAPRTPTRRRTRLWPRSCKAGDPGRHRRAAPCGCGVVETHHLAVVKSRVRFPVSAPKRSSPTGRRHGAQTAGVRVRVPRALLMEGASRPIAPDGTGTGLLIRIEVGFESPGRHTGPSPGVRRAGPVGVVVISPGSHPGERRFDPGTGYGNASPHRLMARIQPFQGWKDGSEPSGVLRGRQVARKAPAARGARISEAVGATTAGKRTEPRWRTIGGSGTTQSQIR